ncbi:hypothetical protein ADK57_25955 [Streptomyces sp. MMG1533]|nr:hypothetical protein ADK57_25955 [Streptomyces sp. MMG1533]
MNPATDGHVLVVPRIHVADFTTDPDVTGATAKRAAELAQAHDLVSANLITSKGRAATQSVFHLHLHLVPRRAGDGLLLPWSEPAVNTVEITASSGVFHTGIGAQHVHVGSR